MKPTKALGIPYVGNKWAHMEMFRDMLPSTPQAYMDLTFGCGICSVFMYEIGVRKFICNDASPYPRLIAEALLGNGARKVYDSELRERIRPPMYMRGGYGSENLPRNAFRRRTVNHIDAVIEQNQDCPLILVAIGAVLSTGAMADWRYGYTKNLTPEFFTSEVIKKARRLSSRVGIGCKTRITKANYLDICDLSKTKGYVCYLDPAWPQQPEAGRKSRKPDTVYGFYASKLMSLLRQKEMPLPPEYDVTVDECYDGMRETILALRKNNTVLIAYQSRPDVVHEVKERLFDGLDIDENAEERKSGTHLWEYLWRVK